MVKDDAEIEESDVASDNEQEQDEDTTNNMSSNVKSEQQAAAGSSAQNGGNGGENREVKKPKLDPKDPLRPRRKKARRACFACQRAHLTCGDERPCQRCIKRGLADACQDGVRKKAKYLHDAPPEALRPVLGPNYNPNGSGAPTRNMSTITNGSSASESSPSVANYFPQVANNSPQYLQYQQMRQHHNGMPPPMTEPMPFLSQPSPISPSFGNSGQIGGNMHMSNTMAAPDMKMGAPGTDPSHFPTGPLFDPSNPALFNFDLDSLNFGNHYGAMEFSMLNHMSSGAAETPPNDPPGLQHQGSYDSAGGVYPGAVQFGGQMYNDGSMSVDTNYSGLTRQDSAGNVYQLQPSGLPRAYAIEAGPISNPSPSTDAHASPSSLVFDASPKQTFVGVQQQQQAQQAQQAQQQQQKAMVAKHQQAAQQQQQQQQMQKTGPKNKFPLIAPSKRRDTSSIYSSVTEPYSYTTGFHALTAFIQRRFSPNSTLKIAKSLASIRPSFIACTKTLTREDLVFMEKCLVRTLVEYEEFMRDCSTPTLVCRRSGEVAAVNKEFSLLTGWSKGVLLGREPNLNVNTGGGNSRAGSAGSTGRAGLVTPRNGMAGGEGRPSFVLLAELLDDDSVIDFYEDFARLAFGDSRGYVRKRCKILKYKSKVDSPESGDGPGQGAGEKEEKSRKEREEKSRGEMMMGGRVSKIDGEWGISKLERDGKLDCSYCWTVKRDVFDIPMLIVMNFLPCI